MKRENLFFIRDTRNFSKYVLLFNYSILIIVILFFCSDIFSLDLIFFKKLFNNLRLMKSFVRTFRSSIICNIIFFSTCLFYLILLLLYLFIFLLIILLIFNSILIKWKKKMNDILIFRFFTHFLFQVIFVFLFVYLILILLIFQILLFYIFYYSNIYHWLYVSNQAIGYSIRI